MTTAEEYKDLANRAYLVDPLKRDPPLAKDDEFNVGSGAHKRTYVVLDTEDNPVNGFQAMAVAPLVNGAPDLSQITLSYAGTNPDHRADIAADVQSIVDNQQGLGTQVMDAKLFADRVKAAHKGATFTTAGHSLGAFLAMIVASENGWSATTFNGPDPWEWLSPEARNWLRSELAAGRNPLSNYVNEWDAIGNLYANKTGAAVFVADRPGRPALDYHNIGKNEAFAFNADGSVTGAGVEGRRLDEIVTNVLDGYAPGLASALGPVFSGLVANLRNPAVMKTLGSTVSGVIVAVNTVSALGLAASIGGTAASLTQIKLANGRLIPRMEEGLLAAKNAASLLPYVTTDDIENCVDLYRLHVHQNIDEAAVAEVDELVDHHIATVSAISDGIARSVQHTIEQDAQWAITYGTH
jgi:hypothetical protein